MSFLMRWYYNFWKCRNSKIAEAVDASKKSGSKKMDNVRDPKARIFKRLLRIGEKRLILALNSVLNEWQGQKLLKQKESCFLVGMDVDIGKLLNIKPGQFGHGENVEDRTRSKEEPVPGTGEFGYGKNVKERRGSKEEPVPRTEEFGYGKNVKERRGSKEEPVPRTEEFGYEKNVKEGRGSKEEPVPRKDYQTFLERYGYY